jgi:sigma-E factor negative regulatory protein RseA
MTHTAGDWAGDSTGGTAVRERLSALVDGELDAVAVVQACAAWREDGDARIAWHAYQLIGDVLRSEDLANAPRRDVALLQRLRAQLADEPVVLAPQPLPHGEPAMQAHARRRSWIAPAAMAAGFAAVAGVLVLTRAPGVPSSGAPDTAVANLAPPAAAAPSTSAGPALAAATTVAPPQPQAVVVTSEPQPLVANGKLIRDARLDRYLAAHKQFAGSSALGVPSAFLRSATADASDR